MGVSSQTTSPAVSSSRNASVRALLRALFGALFAIAGFLLGREAYLHVVSLHVAGQYAQAALLIGVPVLGAVAGVAVTPYVQVFFETALLNAEGSMEELAPLEIVGGAIGLTAGLIVAFLIKNILFEFIGLAGKAGATIATVLYIIISVFAAFLGARVGAKQRVALAALAGAPSVDGAPTRKIVDTSVIVDGRIVEIAAAGFLEPPLVVPRFVLHEVQQIADSLDPVRRARGRRGLEVLAKLQDLIAVTVGDEDPEVTGVDAKLVAVAKASGGAILTNDYNLNRVARVEGVRVLNLNDLANAIKPMVLAGEEMHVAITRDGKEPHQGVGYLEDGTMIVVENGKRMIGSSVGVVVTSVLQTSAGRMIFARPKRTDPR